MKIINKEQRLQHTLSTISHFMENEYKNYSVHKLHPFCLVAEPYLAGKSKSKEWKSYSRKMNVQLLVTDPLLYPSRMETPDLKRQFMSLVAVTFILREYGLEPSVSISGGEPVLFHKHCLQVSNYLKMKQISHTLTTSGYFPDNAFDILEAKKMLQGIEKINLSVYSPISEQNDIAFGTKKGRYWELGLFQEANIQQNFQYGVCCKNNLETFIDSFSQQNFSIQLSSQTKTKKEEEWKELFQKMEKDCCWEFKQQEIGDCYWEEDWRFFSKKQGSVKNVHFSFFSSEQLVYYKKHYVEQETDLCRAITITPNGDVQCN